MLLQRLLSIAAFEHAEILAGELGLTKREVKSINIMDAPDIVTFLQAGALLLTNGYILKQRSDSVIDFIKSMHKKGCAGLALKTKRFDLAIPQEVLDFANEKDFPIIELSQSEHTLGETFQQSFAFMLESKNDELHYALNIHKQFSDMIVHRDGETRIVESLAEIINEPVLLLDAKGQVRFGANSSNVLNDRLFFKQLVGQVKNSQSLQSNISLCLLGEAKKPYPFVELFPIWTYRHEATLIVLTKQYPLSSLSRLAAEQAAHVLGLELVKIQAVKERSRRYKNEFFSDLIDGYVTSEQEALHRGGKYGLNTSFSGRMLVIAPDEGGLPGSKRNYEQQDRFTGERDDQYIAIKQKLLDRKQKVTIFTKNEWFTILLFQEDAALTEQGLISMLQEIIDELRIEENISFSIGVGSHVKQILDLTSSYREAFETLQTQLSQNKHQIVKMYEAMELNRLLRLIPPDELSKYHYEAFKGYLTDQNAELFHTVRVYYENNCQIHDTAKSLFVHRNTVIYRLEKYERLTGRQLKDASESLKFRIACEIHSILHEDRTI